MASQSSTWLLANTDTTDVDLLADQLDYITVGEGIIKQSAGNYICQARQPLIIFNSLTPIKKYHSLPESFKLFSILYSFWKATDEMTIPVSNLGQLIRAQHTDIYNNTSAPYLTTLLRRLINAKFPIHWTKESLTVDFSSMIQQIKRVELFNRVDQGILARFSQSDP